MIESKSSLNDNLFDGIMRGFIINNVDPKGDGKIAVIIPKLMPEESRNNNPKDFDTKAQINDSIIDNNENTFNKDIQKVNFFWARPTFIIETSEKEKTVITPMVKSSAQHQTVEIDTTLNLSTYNKNSGNYDIPRINTTVYVFFEDGDPQKCFYLPYAPTLDGEVIGMSFVESTDNINSMEKKVNIKVIKELHNGNVIYFDTNENENSFLIKFSNGHRIKIDNNENSSAIVLDTEYGHQVKLVDNSSSNSKKNSKDSNNEDGIESGKFIKIETPKKHHILLDDNDGKEKIHIHSMTNHQVLLDDVVNSVHVHTGSGSTIDMLQGDIINIKTSTTINANAKTINVSGGKDVNVTGGSVVNVSAPKVTVSGSDSVGITSSGAITCQAPTINLNP